ncbi:hypothetical protein CBR_g25836 [Chara braunii]|uniref:DUF659 domain-containing protein n=1 Tax=Chara braunii TaxID=69332 RepID=A0A388L6J3_CHABU|nr:hypothetical protein CBR_g25836 [Chara braunii]|eukprot:GBG77904.1 hypothetical protein CBR_g25836 [Chara braunii]
MKQSLITDSETIVTKNKETQRIVDDWMTAHCIPFNMMKSEEWDNMVKALMNAHESFKYAKYEKARTTRVEVTKGRVAVRVEELQRQWPVTGCLLQLDGWTDRRARPHINVMVSFPKGAIFWRSVCMSNRSKGAVAYREILKRAIEEVEEDAVVGVVMDNAAVEIVAKPGATRFATNFIVLNSLQRLYLPIRSCLIDEAWKEGIVNPIQRHLFHAANEIVLDDIFWVGVQKLLETSKGLLSLLKFVDGDGPTISKIYGRMDTSVENLRESKTFTEVEKEELETIIMRRWNVMTSPLHCATMFLDPEYKATKTEQDLEVANGFWTWVYAWCKPVMYKEVDAEVNNWIDGVGKFRSETATQEARGMQPARWWRKWCSKLPHLQKQAIRLLGQGSSSSSCERNWSLFERIHSRPRNRLETVKRSTLVYNRWNQHLLKKLTKKPKMGEDELLWEEDLDLEKKEVQAHANMRVEEWRCHLREENRRRECDDESEEDDRMEEEDDDVADAVEAEENNGEEGQMVRTRIQGSLLELERELNDSWRKSTKPSKYLARLHLGEMQEAAKTMSEAHAEKILAARPKASSLAPKSAKRKPGRPRKVVEEGALIEDGGGAIENGAEDESCESQEQPASAAPKPAKRRLGRPRKVAEEETTAREETVAMEDSENDAEGEKGDAFDSEEEPLACKKRKQSESTD